MRTNMNAILLAAQLTVAASVVRAESPAFDCSKASGSVEEMICGNDELAALDRKLNDSFKAALDVAEGFGGAAARGSEIRNLKAWQRGWIKGRNDCWKADDIGTCVRDAYQTRITELQVQYLLVKAGEPVFYICNGNPADEIVATFIRAELPAVRLERGDETLVGIGSKTASGSRYDAPFGVVFRTNGDEAKLEWPQGNEFKCAVRK